MLLFWPPSWIFVLHERGTVINVSAVFIAGSSGHSRRGFRRRFEDERCAESQGKDIRVSIFTLYTVMSGKSLKFTNAKFTSLKFKFAL